MRHPLTGWCCAGAALAWLAGVALQLQQAALSASGAYAALLAAGGLALGLAWHGRRRRGGWSVGAALLGLAALGYGATGVQAALRLSEALPAALEGVDLQVTGIVASLPQRGPSGLRFRFEVEHAARVGASAADARLPLPSRLSIGWYRGFHEDAILSEPQRALRAGQRWRFTLRLRQPHGTLNPHGYDHELALFEQGVRATGYVRDAPAPQLLGEGAGYRVDRLRQRVRDAIDASVPDARSAGVLAALSIGDQGAIERDDWALFRDTGIAHLMSISGLHVTMFAWLAGRAIGAGWRRSARAALWLPAPLAARWGGLAAAALYTLFSGGGVPSQRTVWMLAAVTLLASLGVRWPWSLVLLAAAVVVTAIDPWALLQPGFWLSFAAVGLLMASGPATPQVAAATTGAPGWISRLRGAAFGGLRTQAVATLGLTPLTLVFFQQVSLVGFVTNLVAIPLVTLVVTPLALLGVLLVPLWTLGAWVVQQGVAALAWAAAWPASVWLVPVAPAWAQLAGLLGALIAVLPLPWRVRALALPLVLALLWPAPPRPPEGVFELLALDVGQGSAVLVRTRGHLLVYDAGPQYSRDADAGRRVLLPALRARGEARLDVLLLSHRDGDHVGGARALLTALPVDRLLSSLEPGHALREPGRAHTRCETGQAWTWDGVRFEILHPVAADYERALKTNAMSCVLRVSSPQASVLLTGDIEREQEGALLQRLADGAGAGATLNSDVLLAPHHGSKTSSSDAFLAAVQPATAIFQAGYRNRFGHPAPEVLARYERRGIVQRASPDCGAWQFRSDAPQEASCERERRRRYWHWRSAG